MKFKVKKLYDELDGKLRARKEFLWWPMERKTSEGVYWHWLEWTTVCEMYDKDVQRWREYHRILGVDLERYSETIKLYNNTQADNYNIFKHINEDGKCVVEDYTVDRSTRRTVK